MRRTLLICLVLLAVGLTMVFAPGCQTKKETVTAPDGTVTVTETSEVDQEAIGVAVAAAQTLGNLATSIATQITGAQAQAAAAEPPEEGLNWTAMANALTDLYNTVTAEKAKYETTARSLARDQNVKAKGLGAFYVDPITGDAVCNTESLK